MEKIQKNDFIEIEFTGTSNGNVFDTTNPEQAKKIGMKAEVSPIIVSVGNNMLLKGFDSSLEGKEVDKEYKIHLAPENAFGNRNPSLIKIIPAKIFEKQNLRPVPGVTVQLDNYIAKILSVSGGRVSVDFNNPLAGKEIDYRFTIKRKVVDTAERMNALQDFFFKHRFEFEVMKDEKGSPSKILFKGPEIQPLIQIFKKNFEELLGVEIEAKKDKPEPTTEKQQ